MQNWASGFWRFTISAFVVALVAGACHQRSAVDEWGLQVAALEARLDKVQAQLDSLAAHLPHSNKPADLRSKEGLQAAEKALGVNTLRQFLADVRLRFGSEKARVDKVLASPSAEATGDATATAARLDVLAREVEASLGKLVG